MQKIFLFLSFMTLAFTLQAGGDPDLVKLPAGYQSDFKLYHSMNRVGKPQVVDLYANQKALDSVGSGEVLNDAIVIMEIYKAKMDAEGNPVIAETGLFEKDTFAAIAVMEKQQWGEEYAPEKRAGDWGFALYTPDGSAKANDLNCASCHIPLKAQDYLFSFEQLTSFK